MYNYAIKCLDIIHDHKYLHYKLNFIAINRNNQIFHEFKKQTKIDLSTSSSVRLEQIQLFAY